MPDADYEPGEITARGEAIYMEWIFPNLEQSDKRKYVSIDIASGDYEIDADDPYAILRLRERRPDGVFYGVRVGYWSPDGRPVAGYLGYWPPANQKGIMPNADYAPGEVRAKGAAIYMERIFPTLDQSDKGKFVSIEIESGDYEIDAVQLNAMVRLRERRPKGVYYGVRVGYWSSDGRPVAGYLGFRPPANQEGIMPNADYAPGEVRAKGAAIYMERIFPTLEQSAKGKFVSIEIESGDYEIDSVQLNAMLRLRERRPKGVYYGVRVGYWSPDGRPIAGLPRDSAAL